MKATIKYSIIVLFVIYPVIIRAQCKADFEPRDVIWPAIPFWNYSEGDFLKYYWTFGDGNTSTTGVPVNYYDTAGTYHVCLKVWNDDCVDSICKDITVYYPCPPEYFNFGYYVYGDSVVFLASGSDHLNLFWDFGDGNTSTEIVPYNIYEDTGIYKTCLSAANYDSSCFDTVCHYVRVGYPGLVANFTYQVTGHFVDFFDSSYRYEGIPSIATRFWNFGDNDSTDRPYSDGISVYHNYRKSGKYNVCLTISDWKKTQTSVFCDSIYIDSINCKTYFQITENQGCSGGLVSFVNLSEFENETDWIWLYGDGSMDTVFQPGQKDFNVWYEYWGKGICLYALDSEGCEDLFCLPLEISCPDNIKDLKSNTSFFNVFPNPASTVLNVNIKEQIINPVNIKLYNSIGILVLEKDINYFDTFQLNIDNFVRGFYLLVVQAGDRIYLSRVIIK
jgi:PKD repeat protein